MCFQLFEIKIKLKNGNFGSYKLRYLEKYHSLPIDKQQIHIRIVLGKTAIIPSHITILNANKIVICMQTVQNDVNANHLPFLSRVKYFLSIPVLDTAMRNGSHKNYLFFRFYSINKYQQIIYLPYK